MKERNVTIKLPKAHNKVNILRFNEIISYAVMITHLPSYVFFHICIIIHTGNLSSGGYHPCRGFHVGYHTIMQALFQYIFHLSILK
jgi:hypothetical protein